VDSERMIRVGEKQREGESEERMRSGKEKY
jgi:hypothetical protein